MVLRTPSLDLKPELALEGTGSLEWQILHCQLVTPMYGGGVKAHTVDKDMPIRVSSIRGQLRFWWRLLATHLWKIGDTQAIRQAEADLWGGIDDKTKASKVFLRVSDVQGLAIAPWAKYEENHRGNKVLNRENWADAPYVLFPAQGKVEAGQVTEEPHELAKSGLIWQLHVAFATQITDLQCQQSWEAIRWWSQFGGLGARTRRGLGAVQLTHVVGSNTPDTLRTPITTEEARQAGCQLRLRPPQNNAYAAWQGAISKLQEFRQLPGLGRNPGQQANRPGRSRWPEPDAIRRLTRCHAPEHAPAHQAGNQFPRAAFGLPIIFHFQGRGEPGDTSLQPVVQGQLEERMASPIILRPYLTPGNQWSSAALLLPHAHIHNLSLKLSGHEANYWNPAMYQHIPPIAQNGGQDPLSAFMIYFAR